ncbi:MAG: DUF2958 domain-containing protein [Chitinophagales bacterium]|nr:DUF2958 domain-containing protein [Chitinophagales bacterium]
MKLISDDLIRRFAEIGDQSQVEDPIIVAKFFDPTSSATWYASAFDPERNICMGYVTGLAYDEWGSFSIDELESLKRPFGLTIERDTSFHEKTFAELEKELTPEHKIPETSHSHQQGLEELRKYREDNHDLSH